MDHHASIGAGAIVLGGLHIGAYAMVAAGSVVTKNVPSRALVMGNPAIIVAWLNEDGSKMIKEHDGWRSNDGSFWILNDDTLSKK